MISIAAPPLTLRPWRRGDEDRLVELANDRRIWINLRDRFPHPYTRIDADAWIAHCEAIADRPPSLALDLDGAPIGGIGIEPHHDVARLGAEVGYWIGRPYWGQGHATRALVAYTAWAFPFFGLERLQACVFDWNPASARVLEKAGYAFEGRMRRAVFKDGRFCDMLLYSRLRDDPCA
jgi:RimJ/RimL family protein N-acetyltransferase